MLARAKKVPKGKSARRSESRSGCFIRAAIEEI